MGGNILRGKKLENEMLSLVKIRYTGLNREIYGTVAEQVLCSRWRTIF